MRRLLTGIVAGTASFGIFLLVHLMLGAVTGVIAMCQTASDRWVTAYLYSSIWILPACLWTAVGFTRRLPGLSFARVAVIVVLVIVGEAYLVIALRDLASL